MQLVAQIDARLRPDLDIGLERWADLRRPHALDHAALERLAHRLDDDEALGGNAALARVDEPTLRARRDRGDEIGVLEHHVGVAAAELEHRLLDHAAGLGRHRLAGGDAAGERHGSDLRPLDDAGDAVARNQQRREQARRQPGVGEEPLDRERAAGDVGGVLENDAVAGHERRRRGAEDLPEREVPRHHGEQHAQRLVGDEALPRLRRHLLVGEERPPPCSA